MTAKIFLKAAATRRDSEGSLPKKFQRTPEETRVFRDTNATTLRMWRSRGCLRSIQKGARTKNAGGYVAMLIDSEDPIDDIEATWHHLRESQRDGWAKPEGARDDQVLL